MQDVDNDGSVRRTTAATGADRFQLAAARARGIAGRAVAAVRRGGAQARTGAVRPRSAAAAARGQGAQCRRARPRERRAAPRAAQSRRAGAAFSGVAGIRPRPTAQSATGAGAEAGSLGAGAIRGPAPGRTQRSRRRHGAACNHIEARVARRSAVAVAWPALRRARRPPGLRRPDPAGRPATPCRAARRGLRRDGNRHRRAARAAAVVRPPGAGPVRSAGRTDERRAGQAQRVAHAVLRATAALAPCAQRAAAGRRAGDLPARRGAGERGRIRLPAAVAGSPPRRAGPDALGHGCPAAGGRCTRNERSACGSVRIAGAPRAVGAGACDRAGPARGQRGAARDVPRRLRRTGTAHPALRAADARDARRQPGPGAARTPAASPAARRARRPPFLHRCQASRARAAGSSGRIRRALAGRRRSGTAIPQRPARGLPHRPPPVPRPPGTPPGRAAG